MSDASFRKRCCFILLVLSLGLPSVLATSVNITVAEGGKIISFYDQYYIYQLNGSVAVTNPSNSTLNNIEIPLYVSTLDIRTNYSKQFNYMTPQEIYIFNLPGNATETFYYRLLGISTEDLSTNNESVLANGINLLQPKIYSSLFGTLKKAPLEDVAQGGRPNTRLISVELRNPTDYDYTIDKVKVVKTDDIDPGLELAKWSFTGQKPMLAAREGWDFDFLDTNATEGQVYWLSTDIYIDRIEVYQSSNISRYDQDDLFVILSNETLNETGAGENATFLADRVYLRKFASATLMTPGETVNMTVLVSNLEPRDVSFTVYDPLPSGFDVLNVRQGSVRGKNVTWNVTLSSGMAKRLRYQLRYADPDSLGIDYFRPAHLTYRGQTYYSQSIPFVRKYVPERKVFVQKSVKFLSGEEVQVTISVQNLGESSLQDVMVREHLLSTAEFREISQQPVERGLWKLDDLRPSGTWRTTYITDKMSVLNVMPELYGVPPESVMQTIILSNVVMSKFSLLSTHVVEIVGIVVLVILVGLYFVPTSFFSRVKRRQAKDLSLMSRELSSLRERTDGRDRPSPEEGKVRPMLTPSKEEVAQRSSGLRSPDRLARHAALEKSAELLERAKERTARRAEEEKERSR
ncbi:DUF11 domain-containing protein [Candidatus Woesearchaeota archaeon]|nr:DUF11 domain-containing protein [Candidatus Woesearchaeota archaeon]